MTKVTMPEPARVNAIFETENGEVIGTTEARVKRVERQDDGSLTVVIDHWPQPAEPDEWKLATEALDMLEALYDATRRNVRFEHLN